MPLPAFQWLLFLLSSTFGSGNGDIIIVQCQQKYLYLFAVSCYQKIVQELKSLIEVCLETLYDNILPVPSPDKRGELGVGPANPPPKKATTETETRQKTAHDDRKEVEQVTRFM